MRNKEGGGRPPLPFFLKIEKKALILGKKGPDSVVFWIKFSIQNVVLRVSRRKNFKIFQAGPFFLCFLTKFLLKCPNLQNFPCPEKFLVAPLRLRDMQWLMTFVGCVDIMVERRTYFMSLTWNMEWNMV